MPSTRRQFLQSTAAASLSPLPSPAAAQPVLDGFEIARSHWIVREGPTPEFFEGMLLGNGDIGLCITVRPDALGLHIGKSDSWDIRVSEEQDAHVLSFANVLKLWQRASDEAKRQGKPDMLYLERDIPFFREYTAKVTASYSKTWPRPWPCGTVWVHWDASRTQVLRQTLDPSCGHFQLDLLQDGRPVRLEAFVNTTTGGLCAWSNSALEVSSVAYYPNLDVSAQLPAPEINGRIEDGRACISAYQLFPSTAPTADAPHPPSSPKDRNFALYAVLEGTWQIEGASEARIFLRSAKLQRLRLDLALFTPRDHADNVAHAEAEARRFSAAPVAQLQRGSDKFWRDFWSQSAVKLEDKDLERWWYHNQYWLACCLRAGKIAPGLFGNWTSGKIGTAWHGDYHMNYNTQQVFWGVFSSNHPDQHLPYIELVENLLDMSQRYARDKFKLPGAYFPHSAYPVPSNSVPYPAPPWGYEICETPWVVQSLWWHYLYTGDKAILRRVYPLLKAAAQFIAAYVKREDDGKYHVFPTVSPENWGCTVDFRLNRDCIMDLALIDFLLEAVVKGSEVLRVDAPERSRWEEIRTNLAAYPRARAFGAAVWLDVPNAPTGWIYNIPVTLAPVFPGERVGLHSNAEELAVARHTAKTIRLEGGNDIVFQPLIRARLGVLDLKWFKQEIRYCQLPNGIVNDRVRQTGGRYKDSTDFDFMMRMGVWTENLSLPVVINECLLQSYSGVIRLFPNTQNLGPARFHKLRAAGAFLVSAAWDGHRVEAIEILSERGNHARVAYPWGTSKVTVLRPGDRQAVPVRYASDAFEFPTEPDRRYHIVPQA
jgi:alpha-L-fucosidase 2